MIAVSACPRAWTWRGSRRRFAGGVLPRTSLLRAAFEGRPGGTPQNGVVVSPDFNSRWAQTDTFAVQGRILVPEFGAGLRRSQDRRSCAHTRTASPFWGRPVQSVRFGHFALSQFTSATSKSVAKSGQPTNIGGCALCRLFPALRLRIGVQSSRTGLPPRTTQVIWTVHNDPRPRPVDVETTFALSVIRT